MNLLDQIKELWREQILRLHNDYCSENNMDDYIYENDPYVIDEMFSSVSEAMRSVTYGDWNPHHAYFQFNGYGNIESFEAYNINDKVDEALLAEWVREQDNHSDYDLEETRFCEITNEEISEGYYIEDQGIWIADKDNLVDYIIEHYSDELPKSVDEYEDNDELLTNAHENDIYCFTTVD